MKREMNKFEDTKRAQDKMIFPKFGDDDKSGTFHHCIACVKEFLFRMMSDNDAFTFLQTKISDMTHKQAKEIMEDGQMLRDECKKGIL